MMHRSECYNVCSELHMFWGVFPTFRIVNSRSPLFKGHHFMFFGSVRKMFPYTGFTQVDTTNVAAHREDRGLTEVTPDDVLGAVVRVRGLISF